jgi:4a-hydroxytetrahydrobiopterin dehydratase
MSYSCMSNTAAVEPFALTLIPESKSLIEPKKNPKTILQLFMDQLKWNKPNEVAIVEYFPRKIFNTKQIVKYHKLHGRELIRKITELSFWSGMLSKRSFLKREFLFPNHERALKFVNSVSEKALALNHFPKITFNRNAVCITLRTNEIDGISTLDIELATAINSLDL